MNYIIQTPFRVRWSSERGDRQQRNDPEQSASSVQYNKMIFLYILAQIDKP